jgi:hypothetical protein
MTAKEIVLRLRGMTQGMLYGAPPLQIVRADYVRALADRIEAEEGPEALGAAGTIREQAAALRAREASITYQGELIETLRARAEKAEAHIQCWKEASTNYKVSPPQDRMTREATDAFWRGVTLACHAIRTRAGFGVPFNGGCYNCGHFRYERQGYGQCDVSPLGHGHHDYCTCPEGATWTAIGSIPIEAEESAPVPRGEGRRYWKRRAQKAERDVETFRVIAKTRHEAAENADARVAELTTENENLRRWAVLSPSALCQEAHVQNCHHCDRTDCCDNTNPLLARVAFMEGLLTEPGPTMPARLRHEDWLVGANDMLEMLRRRAGLLRFDAGRDRPVTDGPTKQSGDPEPAVPAPGSSPLRMRHSGHARVAGSA